MENNLYSMSSTELGRYAKSLFRDKLKSLGVNVIDNELNDVDVCVKAKGKFYKIKVKSIRKPNTGYIKIKKKDVDINDGSLFIAAILFYDTGVCKIFLIPAVDLLNENDLFRNRDYLKMKSTPEWGLNVTEKNMNILIQYELNKMLKELI